MRATATTPSGRLSLSAGIEEESPVGASLKMPARTAPPGPGQGRRRFSASYKLAVLKHYEALEGPGAKGAFLRQEGLYSSHIVEWRRAREVGALEALAPKARRPKASAEQKELQRLRGKVDRLEGQLRRHKEALEAQGKASVLLARLLAEGTEDEQQPREPAP